MIDDDHGIFQKFYMGVEQNHRGILLEKLRSSAQICKQTHKQATSELEGTWRPADLTSSVTDKAGNEMTCPRVTKLSSNDAPAMAANKNMIPAEKKPKKVHQYRGVTTGLLILSYAYLLSLVGAKSLCFASLTS